MGPLFPTLMRFLPTLIGMGESVTSHAGTRGAFAAANQRIIGGPSGMLQAVFQSFAGQKRGSGRVSSGAAPDEPVARPRRQVFGAPINFDESRNQNRFARRIRMGEALAEAEGRGGYRIAESSVGSATGGPAPVGPAQSPTVAPGNPAPVGPRAPASGNAGGVSSSISSQLQTGAFNVPGQNAAPVDAAKSGAWGKVSEWFKSFASFAQAHPVGRLTAFSVQFATFLYTGVKALQKFAAMVVESNRGLSMWNGRIASSFAMGDFRQQQRDIGLSNKTEAGVVHLNESFQGLLDETQQFREMGAQVLNYLAIVASHVARMGAVVLKLFPIVQAMKTALDLIEEQLRKGQPVNPDQFDAIIEAAIQAGQPAPGARPAPAPPGLAPRPPIPPLNPGGPGRRRP